MSDTLYLKIDRNIEVCHRDIVLKDVAKMECQKQEMVNRIKTIKLLTIPPEKKRDRYVFSILKVIELIHAIYPNLTVENLGEIDFIIDFEEPRKQPTWFSWAKLVVICIITFVGAGFSIMTFNNDVGVHEIFGQIYKYAMGTESNGFTLLELSYAIGVSAGILVFYNHFGGKKITTDPTPVEVEMRLYEDDINTTLIEGVNRKNKHIDV